VRSRQLASRAALNRWFDMRSLCRPTGQSFHFAHRYRSETLSEAIRRHEHFLALQLRLKKGDQASRELRASSLGAGVPSDTRGAGG